MENSETISTKKFYPLRITLPSKRKFRANRTSNDRSSASFKGINLLSPVLTLIFVSCLMPTRSSRECVDRY